MWTKQCEDAEQTIEHGRPSVPKGMQYCWDHGGGRQEFHPLISETIQVNKVMEQESKSTER